MINRPHEAGTPILAFKSLTGRLGRIVRFFAFRPRCPLWLDRPQTAAVALSASSGQNPTSPE
jgi:hypothetical protein